MADRVQSLLVPWVCDSFKWGLSPLPGYEKSDYYHYIDYVNADKKENRAQHTGSAIFSHQNQVPPPDCKLDVSHLCHNKGNINPGQLVLTSNAANCTRRLYHIERQCHENHGRINFDMSFQVVIMD